MIKASEIADAIAAIDGAIRFINSTAFDLPGRDEIRTKLIHSRVDLDFSLREIGLSVEADK